MSSQLDPDDGRDAPAPHASKSADLDKENSNPPKESSRQADEHRTVTAEPQLPVARLLDDPGLQLDEGPAPRRSMSSLWEPDVAPEEPSLYAPKRVRDAASGKPIEAGHPGICLGYRFGADLVRARKGAWLARSPATTRDAGEPRSLSLAWPGWD